MVPFRALLVYKSQALHLSILLLLKEILKMNRRVLVPVVITGTITKMSLR